MSVKDIGPLILPGVFDSSRSMRRLLEEDSFVLSQDFGRPFDFEMLERPPVELDILGWEDMHDFFGLQTLASGFSAQLLSDDARLTALPEERDLADWFG